jgi:hypothetical protein
MPDRPMLDPFNLDSMSGIHPGRRSAVYQRLLIAPRERAESPATWYRLSWDGHAPGPLFHAEGNTLGDDLSEFRLALSESRQAGAELVRELGRRGWTLHACAACAFWREQPQATPDGIAAGRCAYRPDDISPGAAQELLSQSALSLACPQWLAADNAAPLPPAGETVSGEPAPPASSLWRRLVALLFRPQSARRRIAVSVLPAKSTAVGTEPCFVCQGRIARLGSTTFATRQNDNDTFTVWRCHACYTTYLGDWVDRWVRTDSLETEEAFYRIAPAVAADLLAAFEARRAETIDAGTLETRLRALVQETEPLSRQVKQGR